MVAVVATAQHKNLGINLSLSKGIATQPKDTAKSSWLNIGLLSATHRVNGASLNGIASVTSRGMNGAQISGLANMNYATTNAVQISGITNVNYGDMNGISISGLVNLNLRHSSGVVASSLVNYMGGDANGLAVAGLINMGTGHTHGVQLTAMANIAGNGANGLMISAILNLAGADMNGIQLSPIANIAGTTLRGAQVGLVNYATNANGLQLGLFNYYKEDKKGLQLGLINANPNTRYQLMVFGGNSSKFNVGMRFKNQLFYTLLSTGAYYYDFKDKFSATFAYRAGIWFQIYKGLSISGDLGFEHIESFKAKHNGLPPRLYALQERLNLEYEITTKISIFASTGYEISRYYNKNSNYDKRVIGEIGIILF